MCSQVHPVDRIYVNVSVFSQAHRGDWHIWEPCAHQRSRDWFLHLYEQEGEAHWQGKAVNWPQSVEREAKGWQPQCSRGQNVNACSSTARDRLGVSATADEDLSCWGCCWGCSLSVHWQPNSLVSFSNETRPFSISWFNSRPITFRLNLNTLDYLEMILLCSVFQSMNQKIIVKWVLTLQGPILFFELCYARNPDSGQLQFAVLDVCCATVSLIARCQKTWTSITSYDQRIRWITVFSINVKATTQVCGSRFSCLFCEHIGVCFSPNDPLSLWHLINRVPATYSCAQHPTLFTICP